MQHSNLQVFLYHIKSSVNLRFFISSNLSELHLVQLEHRVVLALTFVLLW